MKLSLFYFQKLCSIKKKKKKKKKKKIQIECGRPELSL